MNNKLSKAGLLLLLPLMLASAAAQSDCTATVPEKVDYEYSPEARALHAKKIAYAVAILSDGQYLAKDQVCVAQAMRFLGTFHVAESAPRLTELLSYKRVIKNPMKVLTPADEYPALGALIGIGEPAVPALIRVIAVASEGEVTRKNAIDALMTIYRENPVMGVRALENAAVNEPDPSAAQQLRVGVEEARALGCRGSAPACKKWEQSKQEAARQ